MFTINDKKAHDLSPKARLVVKRARPQIVGHRYVLARVKATLCLSGLTFTMIRELAKTRTGRKHITNLVYRAVKAHYRTEGRCTSYAVKRAKVARLNMKRELRRIGANMLITERYTEIQSQEVIKDTTNPTDSFYGPSACKRISALTPLIALVSALPHNRKPQHAIKPQPKPIAITESGNVFASDKESAKVRRILDTYGESLASVSYRTQGKRG